MQQMNVGDSTNRDNLGLNTNVTTSDILEASSHSDPELGLESTNSADLSEQNDKVMELNGTADRKSKRPEQGIRRKQRPRGCCSCCLAPSRKISMRLRASIARRMSQTTTKSEKKVSITTGEPVSEVKQVMRKTRLSTRF